MRWIFRRQLVAVVCTAFTLGGHNGWSQATETIRIVVPVPAGGSADMVARLLADQIRVASRSAVVVDNRPGAGTAIATQMVARAAPDGGTVLINAAPFLIYPHLRKMDYDPVTGFEPICYLARSPAVIAVNSASSYRTLDDLLSAARAKPGELTLASTGPATLTQIAFATLRRMANVKMTFVPFSGMGPAVNALLGQHVTAAFGNYGDLSEHVKAGSLRALATASLTRIETLPDVPTVAESGYPDYEADVWYGLVAPGKTPKEIVSHLIEWTRKAIQAPDFKSKLSTVGIYPVGTCGAEFTAFLRKRYDEYGRVIREEGITAQ